MTLHYLIIKFNSILFHWYFSNLKS